MGIMVLGGELRTRISNRKRLYNASREEFITHRRNNDIRNSSSSAFKSVSSGVSTCRSVPLFGSHTIALGGSGLFHSSGKRPFSRFGGVEYQHAVAIDPSAMLSARNLSRIVVKESSGGGKKSQGSTMKSFGMRLAKWLSNSHVPMLLSGVSSYVCKSMRRA